MRLIQTIAFILILTSRFASAQSIDSSASGDIPPIHLFTLKPNRIDSFVIYCTEGIYGKPGFRELDSTLIVAYIVLPDFPLQFDTSTITNRIRDIMKQNKWNEVQLFRDELSIGLSQLGMGYELVKKRNGFILSFKE